MEQSLPVLLLDWGAPADGAAVRPYIASVLASPQVLPLPWGLRQGLARFIAWRRAPVVAERYAAVGGSPLPVAISDLGRGLVARLGAGWSVGPAFCHAEPTIDGAVAQLAAAGARRVLGLPVFPQRSFTTVDACRDALTREANKHWLEVAFSPSFPEGGFVQALAAGARPLLRPESYVLAVAHGLPQRLLRLGDPYFGEVRRTAAALAAALGGPPSSLAFQSRMGPAAWVGPDLKDEIRRLAQAGVVDLLVVPVSFATENLETRWDLDHEASDLALAVGMSRFVRAPAPGDHPLLLDQLAALARAAVADAGWSVPGSPS